MNFRPLVQRLAPWLTVYLFVVSVGLPLQRVYCACAGEQWLTVVLEEHECHHGSAAKVQEVHHHGEQVGYHDEKTDHHSVCTSHDCGNTEVIFPQLDVDFTFEVTALSMEPGAVLPPTVFAVFVPRPIISPEVPIRGPTPPPDPSGRALLVAHQTFLI